MAPVAPLTKLSDVVDYYSTTAAVTLLAVYQLGIRFSTAVENARYKYQVKASEVSGPPEFNRIYRAYQSAMEFFAISLVCLWIGSVFCNPVLASTAYLMYLLGREVTFWAGAQDTKNRTWGQRLCIVSLVLLFTMSFWGVTHKLVRSWCGLDVLRIITEQLFLKPRD